ncbi:MAG TPA: hypothetical protein VHC95_12340 [Opitutales bacterium]|nr:hypothetical protein [Opitutales bacterium]
MRYNRVFNVVLLVGAVAYGVYQWRQNADSADEAPPAPVAVTGQPAPPALQEFIAHAIAVYRKQDFTEIVKLMPPAEVQVLQPRGKNLPPDQLGEVLRERPNADADVALNLEELEAVKDRTPVLEEDGTRAVFALATPIQNQPQVVFVKIGGQWYKP